MHLFKRAKRESETEKAKKWLFAEKDQPGLHALFINETIGKFQKFIYIEDITRRHEDMNFIFK